MKRILKICGALGAWALATVALPAGLSALFRQLFAAWGLDAETAGRAPLWAALLYSFHGTLITLLTSGLLMLICRRALKARPEGLQGIRPVKLWLAGMGLALLSAGIFLLTDSLRSLWPLSSPRLTMGLPVVWMASLVSILAEEWLIRGVLDRTLREGWGRVWALVGVTLAFVVMNGLTSSVQALINMALMGLLLGLIYERHGLGGTVAFRWGFGTSTAFLLGQGGGSSAVYRLYGVSENWLTGGDRGLMYGAWMTAGLLIGILRLLVTRVKLGAMPE